MTEKLQEAAAALERAKNAYEYQRGNLFASDGTTPIFEPGEHGRRLAKARQPLEEAAAAATAAAAAATAAAEVERLQVFACPTTALAPTDMAAAGAVAPFIRDECETLALDELAERVRWAVASGGPAHRWLYQRFATDRFRRESGLDAQDPRLPVLAAALRDTSDLAGQAATERRRAAEEASGQVTLAAMQLRAQVTRALDDGNGKQPGRPRRGFGL